MKKILLLGGSAQQVVAIETAKRLGYYTVLCDYLNDNPGQYAADSFHLVSTTDPEAVLQVAKEEQVDGVLAYASDPAAPTAAYVAEQLGLPGNPYRAVDILCNKDKFRAFLAENGFCTPTAKGYTDEASAVCDLRNGAFRFPVIIKPVDSSGSKGATVLQSAEDAEKAVAYAFSFSRGSRIIIEKFITMKHPYLIGGDLFVENGEVVLWGLMNCHRDSTVNPLVPVGKSYPTELSASDLQLAKDTLQTLVDKLGIRSNAMNVELVIDEDNQVWLIDVGPRNGGNMIPDLLSMIFDIDIVEMSVQTAMGVPVPRPENEGHPFYATHNLHTDKNGKFSEVRFSEEIQPYIVRSCVYKKKGDAVEYFDNSAKALGIVFFRFESEKQMQDYLTNIHQHIEIVVE